MIKNEDKLNSSILGQFKHIIEKYQISVEPQTYIALWFREIILALVQKYQTKVVILIDEYDKPILDNLENSEIALQMRDALRDFYSIIKGQDANIRFAMLTGVSKFSKINLFSGLNNLYDVTLDTRFSALCGYTQTELETIFQPVLQDVDLTQIKRWYNGYNWGGESVYNPFDILLFLSNPSRIFKPYWIGTGNTTFLIDKLIDEQINIAQLKNEVADHHILSSFEVGDISPIGIDVSNGLFDD